MNVLSFDFTLGGRELRFALDKRAWALAEVRLGLPFSTLAREFGRSELVTSEVISAAVRGADGRALDDDVFDALAQSDKAGLETMMQRLGDAAGNAQAATTASPPASPNGSAPASIPDPSGSSAKTSSAPPSPARRKPVKTATA